MAPLRIAEWRCIAGVFVIGKVTLLCEIDLQDFWNGVGPFIGIERAKLQQALLIGAAAVPCRLGMSCHRVAARS